MSRAPVCFFVAEAAGPPSKARMNSELAYGEFIKPHIPATMRKGDDLLGKINRWKWFLCKARFILDNKVGGYRCRSQVPEHEILKIVRMYEPIITEFFDNEEEMEKFQKWRDEQEATVRKKKETTA